MLGDDDIPTPYLAGPDEKTDPLTKNKFNIYLNKTRTERSMILNPGYTYPECI